MEYECIYDYYIEKENNNQDYEKEIKKENDISEEIVNQILNVVNRKIQSANISDSKEYILEEIIRKLKLNLI